jgi:hypothetical protein
MRTLLATLALGIAAILFTTGISAQDKKEVMLKGLITCNKCDLMKSTKCETVIVVKNDKKKDVVYFFDAEAHKKYHGDTCSDPKKGSVTGTVKDVDKKKVVTVTALKYE